MAKQLALSLHYRQFKAKPTSKEAALIATQIANSSVELCPAELADAISNGQTWSALFKGKRCSANWHGQQVFAADLDDGEQNESSVLRICDNNCIEPLIIHHSFSSKPEHVKLRVIFVTDTIITDPYEALATQRALANMFGGDTAVCDIARIYYGGRTDCIEYFDSCAELCLTELELEQAIATYTKANSIEPEAVETGDQMEYLMRLRRTNAGRFKLVLAVITEQKHRIQTVADGSGYESVFKATTRLARFRELFADHIRQSVTDWIDECEEYNGWQHRNALPTILDKAILFGRQHLYD